MRWLLDHDPDGVLRYSKLRGETAGTRLAPYAERLAGVDSMVLLEGSGPDEVLRMRSAAVFRLLAVLPGQARWLSRLGWLPTWLTDLGYRVVAKIRHRLFGPPDVCRAPTADERARFLP